MKTAVEIGYFVIPAAVAISILLLARRWRNQGQSLPPSVFALSASVAFFVGYWLLPNWASLVPERHWQWLPYLGLLAAGAASLVASRATAIQLLTYLPLAFVTGWLLVPAWLEPMGIYVLPLATYLFFLVVLLQPLSIRVSDRSLLLQMGLSAAALAAGIAALMSMRYAFIATAAAGSLLGCWLATFFVNAGSAGTRAAIPVFVVLVGGMAFVGCMEPEPPLPALLVMPAAPLGIWICQQGPLARFEGIRAAVLHTIIVLAGLVCAAALALRQT